MFASAGGGNPYIQMLGGGSGGGSASSGLDGLLGGAARTTSTSSGPTDFGSWLQSLGIQLADNVPAGRMNYFGTKSHPYGAVYMGTKSFMENIPASFSAREQGSPDGAQALVQTSPARSQKVSKSGLLTTEQAYNLPATWSPVQQMQAIDMMNKAGFKVSNYDDLMGVWKNAVDRASAAYTASGGKDKMTPWDALSLYAAQNNALGGGTTPSVATNKSETIITAPSTTTHTARTVNDLSPGDGWSIMERTLSQMLGRDPTNGEVRNFTHKMNQLAAADPTVTREISRTTRRIEQTHMHMNAAGTHEQLSHSVTGGNTTSSSTTHTGFDQNDAEMQAYQRAQASPDYGAYQAATTYYNAALAALGAIGNIGTN